MEAAATCAGAASEFERLPAPAGSRSRDLLRHLSAEVQCDNESLPAAVEDVELTLGLSLGGRFGVEPVEKERLVRSSSIGAPASASASASFDRSEDGVSTSVPQFSQPLSRTVSLPVETDEERRRRKELQCLRRLEAKRKRSEKQRTFCYRLAGKEEEKRGDEEGQLAVSTKGRTLLDTLNAMIPPRGGGYGFPGWGSGGVLTGAGDRSGGNSDFTGAAGSIGFVSSSHGSMGSQGSSSSSASDLAQGHVHAIEIRSPVSTQSFAEQVEQKAAGSEANKPGILAETDRENSNNFFLKRTKVEENGVIRKIGKNAMEEMPCVSTRGHGPNGRKIEGFLYKYKKGEEVRIVCVCHGNFLSPAEFVKHAGGDDVQHPLRHIMVNPSPSFL